MSERPWVGALGPAHYRRLAFLTGCLLLGFGVVGMRLVDIQVWQHEALSAEAERQRTFNEYQVPLRGMLLDRNRLTLAHSVQVKTVVADPSLVGPNAWLLATNLAGPLGLEAAVLAEWLKPRSRTNDQGVRVPVRYVRLQRQVPVATWREIEARLRRLAAAPGDPGLSERERERRRASLQRSVKAISTEPVDDQVRVYPGGSLAAHALGFVGANPAAVTNRLAHPITGVEGLERSVNQALGGTFGTVVKERVRRGRRVFVEVGEGVTARPGLNVVLTLDATLQRMVEEELAAAMEKHRPSSVTCVAVDPRTGEILALANLPTFDPNRPGEFPADARRNRAIADEHEPGSTFKVLTVSGALDAGVVSLDDRLDCENGSFRFKGLTLGDVHPYSVLTLEQVLVKSSNIGAAKVGIRMGEGLLDRTVRRFGIGEPTGIPLPGERAGTFSRTNRWSKISVAWIPMGHEVMATPLQMTMAMAAVANRGVMMWPILVRRVEDDRGRAVRVIEPTVRRRVIREETARDVTRALAQAVQSGTGTKAQLDAFTVAGKTGTAQKVVGGVYVHDRHYASFIGFFPAEQPQLCIGVFMDEPRVGKYGGETAAPVFRAIAQRAAAYLGLAPGQDPEEAAGRLVQRSADVPGRM